jgi:hypothetical protein
VWVGGWGMGGGIRTGVLGGLVAPVVDGLSRQGRVLGRVGVSELEARARRGRPHPGADVADDGAAGAAALGAEGAGEAGPAAEGRLALGEVAGRAGGPGNRALGLGRGRAPRVLGRARRAARDRTRVRLVLAVHPVAHDARGRVRRGARYQGDPLVRPRAPRRQAQLAASRIHVAVPQDLAL